MDDVGGATPDAYSKTKKPRHLARSLTYHHHPYQGQGRHPPPSPTFNPQPPPAQAVVLYMTSLRGVRRTFADCCAVRVAVDERDVSMDASLRREVQALLAAQGRCFSLPQLLVGGRLVGGEPTRCGGCTRPASSAAFSRAPRGRTRPSSAAPAAGSASCLAPAATDPARCSWRRRGTPAAAWIAMRTDWYAAPAAVLDHSVHKPFSLPVVQRLLERQEKDELWTQNSSAVGSLSVLGAEQLDS